MMFGLGGRKQGIELELYQAPVPGSPEEHLERDAREWFARVRGADGAVPSRSFYNVAEDVRHPFRVLARRVKEADEARVEPEELRALAQIFARYIERRLARRPGARRPSHLHLEPRSTPRSLPAHALPMGAVR